MFGVDDVFVAVLFVVATTYSVPLIIDGFKQKGQISEYEKSFVKIHEEIINKYQTVDQPQSSEQTEDRLQHLEHNTVVDELPEETPAEGQDDGRVPKWATAKGVIKLHLMNRERENLLAICKSYYSKWTPNYHLSNLFHKFFMKYDPREEVQFITFTKIDPPLNPVPIEVIRCNAVYAIIGVGDGSHDGYLLKTAKKNDAGRVPGEVFNICGKLIIREKEPQEGKDSNGETVETTESEEADDAKSETSHSHSQDEEETLAKEKRSSDGESPTHRRELVRDRSSSNKDRVKEEVEKKKEEAIHRHELARDGSSSDEERVKEKIEEIKEEKKEKATHHRELARDGSSSDEKHVKEEKEKKKERATHHRELASDSSSSDEERVKKEKKEKESAEKKV